LVKAHITEVTARDARLIHTAISLVILDVMTKVFEVLDNIPGRSYLPRGNHVRFLKKIARYST
jgi:predicted phosphohydrolase